MPQIISSYHLLLKDLFTLRKSFFLEIVNASYHFQYSEINIYMHIFSKIYWPLTIVMVIEANSPVYWVWFSLNVSQLWLFFLLILFFHKYFFHLKCTCSNGNPNMYCFQLLPNLSCSREITAVILNFYESLLVLIVFNSISFIITQISDNHSIF